MKFGLISMGSKSSQMIVDEAKKKFDEADLININKVEIKINKEIKILYNGEPLPSYDCLYLRGSYKYSSLLYAVTELKKEECYLPVDANAHLIAHNKFLTHLNFSTDPSLKMPMTYYAPNITETKKFLETLNYPIIMKFPSGTHGKGVIYTESFSSSSSMIDALDIFKQPVLIQDYVDIKSDIRVIVAGDEIVGAMKRTSQGEEVRANAHLGGGAENYTPTPKIRDMALKAAKKIKAEICAIDLIESDYGPLILEVNTSPGLQKITQATKVNVAERIVNHLYNKTKDLKNQEGKVTSKKVINDLGVSNLAENEFETTLKVTNNKIVLPEFATKLSGFENKENASIMIKDNEIVIKK